MVKGEVEEGCQDKRRLETVVLGRGSKDDKHNAGVESRGTVDGCRCPGDFSFSSLCLQPPHKELIPVKVQLFPRH